jgi:hypothetical protein
MQAETAFPEKRPIRFGALPLVIGLLSIGLFFGLMGIYYYLLKLDLDKFI